MVCSCEINKLCGTSGTCVDLFFNLIFCGATTMGSDPADLGVPTTKAQRELLKWPQELLKSSTNVTEVAFCYSYFVVGGGSHNVRPLLILV